MYRYTKDGISVLAVMDRRRKKNNGLYPVKIEVVYRRVQRYYPTGQDVSDEEWESFWKAKRRPHKCICIENSFYHVRNAVEQLAEKGVFNFTRLDGRLGKSHGSVNDAIEKRMKMLMDLGKINSYYRYRSTLHALERFGGSRIPFETITSRWLQKCESFWYHEGKSATTVNIYMKTLQSIFSSALEDGAIRDMEYPFGKHGYRIPPSSRREMALTKKQIDDIRHWKGEPEIEYWRDMWMFSYLCNGINFRDMIFLRYADIKDGEITYVRSKTAHSLHRSKIIRATITPLMSEIMERRGNGSTGDSGQMIFRIAKGNEKPMEVSHIVRKAIASCNAAMKELAADLGIPAFSTYAARHSFATILMKNGTDISFISESLGHSSIAMTENYLGGYDKEERRRYAASLIY